MQADRTTGAYFRRGGILLVCTFVLAGCAIKNDVPDFKYPAHNGKPGDSWPELAVTAELQALGENSGAQMQDAAEDSDQLEARIRRLRARGQSLQNSK